jgi:subtilisin-like proprotein convertase family protein
MIKKFLLGLSILICLPSFSQLTVSNGYTATQLGNTLAGNNVNVTNATITGTNAMRGKFNFVGSGFPLQSGVILSNGNITDAIGPNNNSSSGSQLGQPGHPDLTAIAGTQTFDAVEFKFDFEVQSDRIEFKYIFASEEYNEFVGSGFNDVFAFFISGPGIVGWENIALIPNTTVPVTINNVNNGSYWQYFNDNTNGSVNIQFDGFTDVLTAKKEGLVPCEVYTLKLVIADAGDGILDAAVFLEENSLVQGTVSATANTFSANSIALEGCIDASFTFQLDQAFTTNTFIPIGIGGSAVNGVDYNLVDTMLVIPAGQTSATIIIDALSDGLAEGQESIELYFTPAPCQPQDTVTLFINDYQTLEYETNVSDISCFGNGDGQLDFTITGGTAPFTVMLTDSATNVTTTHTTLPITGLEAGTYFINVIDGYGCPAEDIVAGNLYTGGAVFVPDGTGQSYQTTLPIAGMPATLTSVNQIQSICITMEHSRIGELEILLQAPDGTLLTLKEQPGGAVTNMGEPCAIGPADAGNTDTSRGVGYTYCFTPNPTYGTLVSMANVNTYSYTTLCYGTIESDKYLPAGSYAPFQSFNDLIGVPINGNWTIIVTDQIPNNNGWIFDWSITFQANPPDSIAYITEPESPAITYTSVQPTCGNNTGSINVTTTGTNSPFTFSWSSGQTTEDISGVGAGTYILTVTDANSCTNDYTITLSNNGGTTATAVATPQQCVGTNSGSIDLTIGTGPSPITYLWSNGATTQDISSLTPGTYSVNVTDGAGCITSASATINAATSIIITGNVTNESCGDQEGAIDINVIGGNNSSYSYLWSNSTMTQDITDLSQGNYSVTVTDANNCQQNAAFSVINIVGSCIPDCDLTVTNSLLSNEICGNNNGAIGVNISTTNAPYTISWSNGATTSNITNLIAGTYSVTVNDNEGCSSTQSFSITNQTGSLSVSGTNLTNETCGNGLGAIDITVSGGSQPYSYLWSNSATTQDINSLSAGNYSVDITDGNGCTLNQNFSVINNAGTMTQTYGNAEDEICGNGQGSIDITVTGGQFPLTYLWTNGATSTDLIGISAGTYQCTITDGSGCQLSTPVYTVNNQSGGLTLNNVDIDNEVCGNSQGEILLAVSGGGTPYSYSWNTGATSSSLVNLTDGTYSCIITDANGCSVSTGNLIVVDESGTLQVVSVSTTNEICSNGTGVINLTVTGGTAPINYLWNNNSTSQDLYNLSAGSYSCTISDANGCSTIANAFIQNETGTLQIDNMIVTDEICGDGSGAIDLMISGQSGVVNYSWSNSASTQDINSLSAGNYSVTITDASGCSVNGNTMVGNNSGGFSVDLVSITNETCGNANGAIDVTVSGGSSPYSFNWSNSATTEDITTLSAGNYSLTVTDDLGCSVSTSNFTVNNSSGTLAISNAVITDEICNNNAGGINITVSGGNSPYGYLWSNSATTQDISSLNNGNYSVTVTDANGCSITGNYTVNDASGTLAITTSIITDATCGNTNGAIDITITGGSGSYTYSWSNSATTQDISSLGAGNYSVTVNDGTGCTVTGNNYTVNSSSGNFQLISVSTVDAVCGNNGGSVNVVYTGGQNPITYSWSNGATTEDITNLVAGVYSSTATDANGCEINVSGVVNNDPGSLDLGNPIITQSTCGNANGAIDAVVTGGSGTYTYIWSNGANTQDISSLSTGNYSITVNDGNGCMQNATYSINGAGGTPVITGFSINDEICGQGNGSATVNVSGGAGPYTYDWDASPCCTYTLTMTGGAPIGWTSAKVEVFINSTLYGQFNNTGNTTTVNIPVCNGDDIDLSYIPGGTSQKFYTLYDASGNLLFTDGPFPPAGPSFSTVAICNGGASTATFSGLGSGTYPVTVTDANGCSVTDSVSIGNSPGTFAISNAVVTNFNCGILGSINISLTGNVNPVTYLWSNGATTQDINNLSAGTYTVDITNGNGCMVSETYVVNNITNGTMVSDTIILNEVCSNGTGSIDITVTGGSAPYSFVWSNGATTEDLTSLNSGNYTVDITDNDGCLYSETYSILNIITNTAVTASNIIDENCGDGTGAIDITVNGSASPFDFSWSNSATTEDITGLDAGSYEVTITDASGCVVTDVFVVNNITNGLTATTIVTEESCSGNDGAIDLTITGGVPSYSIIWSNSEITEDLSGLSAGVYSYSIEDATGCQLNGSATLMSQANDITITNSNITDDFCGDGVGAINLTVTATNIPLTYSWNSGQTTDDLNNLTTGSYIVEIFDTQGCSLIDTFVVNNSAFYFVSDTVITDATCATCADGSINITIAGAGTLTYSWSNGATTQDISGLLPGTYTVTMNSAGGCTLIQTYIVDSTGTISVAENFWSHFEVYPNPTTGMLYIIYSLREKSDLTINVESILGQSVMSQNIGDTQENRLEVDLSSLERGIYFITLSNGSEKITTRIILTR